MPTAIMPERNELKTYEEYKTLGVQFRKNSDQCDWELGDLIVEVCYLADIVKTRVQDLTDEGEQPTDEQKAIAEERNIVSKFADDIGWSRDHLVARKRVSEAFRRNHWVRGSSLSFSHARALATIEDEEHRDILARRAVEERLSHHALCALIKEEKAATDGQDKTVECEHCHRTIQELDVMIKVIQGKTTFFFCSWNCNAQFAYQMSGDRSDSLVEDLNVDGEIVNEAPLLLSELEMEIISDLAEDFI